MSKNVKIDEGVAGGCLIDLDSRDHKDTREGNYVIYNCNLSVPSNLTDSLSDISYGPLELICDNIRIHPVSIITKGKYINPYSIELASKDLTVNQNKTEFNVIVYSSSESDVNEFPYSASLESDILKTSCEKLSEKNYKCSIDSIAEGSYNMNFTVTETGCPPCIFPLEITCTKKGKATVKLKLPAEKPQNDSTVNAELPAKDVTAMLQATDGIKESATPLSLENENCISFLNPCTSTENKRSDIHVVSQLECYIPQKEMSEEKLYRNC
ncbi:MAG: hypothetical protein K2M16_01235 [Muribaculaceae bacterium]|nr:hypothetical protein [Muribaculaceae bacterium]